jgi:hypothetical protein
VKKMAYLLPLVILIVSCGGIAVQNRDFLPLAVGNQWNYDMYYSMMMTSDTVRNTGASVTAITRQTALNNTVEVLEQVTTNTWDDTLTNPNSVDTTYLLLTDDYLLVYDDLADTEPDTSLDLPFSTGKTWVVYADTTDTLTAEVIGQETVTVPAGSYDVCYNVEYTSLGQTQNDWFAEDVGIAKYIMTIDQGFAVLEFRKELESYSLH